MLLGTGSGHLTWARTEFRAQVPDAVLVACTLWSTGAWQARNGPCERS
jgi:hypothetical protein